MIIIERLQRAINTHDLEALVACFSVDVESRQPAHPSRNFRGRDQVRRNWTAILAAVPDLHASLLDITINGADVWTEWHWHGTRESGAAFDMRGVTVQRVVNDEIAGVRFFMEPVEHATAIDGAVRDLTQ
jgi:ketosteroid isomerase-like protein